MSTKYNTNTDTIDEFLFGNKPQGSNNPETLRFARQGKQCILFHNGRVFAIYDTFGTHDGRMAVCITHDIRTKSEQKIADTIKEMAKKLPQGTPCVCVPLPKYLYTVPDAANIGGLIHSYVGNYLEDLLSKMESPAQYPAYIRVTDIINKKNIDTLYGILDLFNAGILDSVYKKERVEDLLKKFTHDDYGRYLLDACLCHNVTTAAFDYCKEFFQHCGNSLHGIFIHNVNACPDLHTPEALSVMFANDTPDILANEYLDKHHLIYLEHAARFLKFAMKDILARLLKKTATYLGGTREDIVEVSEADRRSILDSITKQFHYVFYDRIDWTSVDWCLRQLNTYVEESCAHIMNDNVGLTFKKISGTEDYEEDRIRLLKFYQKHILPTLSIKDIKEGRTSHGL